MDVAEIDRVEVSSRGEDLAMLTRREALKRGVALSGVVWATPVVTSMQLLSGTASVTSPTTTTTSTTTTSTTTTTTTIPDQNISFIGMQVSCEDGLMAMGYTIKYEGCEGGDCFESDPGKFPNCDGFMVSGEKADGDDLGFQVVGPDSSGCVDIIVPADCVVTASVVKSGQCCVSGPAGAGTLTFCPPTC